MLPGLWFYLDHLGQKQSDKLGQILVAQLASQARQPLLYQDKISQQVLVNRLVDNNDEVIQAAIFDLNKTLQVQSDSEKNHGQSRWQEDRNNQTSSYHHPIKVEQKAAGQAQLLINSARIKRRLDTLFWLLTLSWAIFSGLLCLGLKLIANSLSQRLSDITSGLPANHDTQQSNEISRLEASIKPLLVKPLSAKSQLAADSDQDQNSESLILVIRCKNLRHLKSQLSQQNYQQLLSAFDGASNCATDLFHGTRLPGSEHCVHLNFNCDGNRDNALLRAISCYLSIADIMQTSAPESGSGLVLCAAIGLTDTSGLNSLFEQDQEREAELQRLISTTTLAGPRQLLIKAILIDEATAPSARDFSYTAFSYKASAEYHTEDGLCVENELSVEDNRATGPETESRINPDGNRPTQVRFEALNAESQELLAGQLLFLRGQLSSPTVKL